MPINPNWFSANAPQVQPGGGGFQEQQPGVGGMIGAGQNAGAAGNIWQPNTGVIGGTQMGAPFAGLMQAGQLGSGMAQGNIWNGQMGNPSMGGWAGNMARGGQMMGNVLLRAPDGSTKSVPAGEMQHWLGRGAVRF